MMVLLLEMGLLIVAIGVGTNHDVAILRNGGEESSVLITGVFISLPMGVQVKLPSSF